MNTNEVNIRAFLAILGLLFLAVGTVFAGSTQTCLSEQRSCCVQSRAMNAGCNGRAETSRPASRSCCAAITGATQHASPAVVRQDSEKNSRVTSDAAVSVSMDGQPPRVQSPFRGRADLYDSHFRMSVAKYVLTSTFLI